MLAPIMPGGLVCGYNATQNFPVLYVPNLQAAVDPITDYFNYGMCAKSCPGSAGASVECYDQAECDKYTVYETNQALDYCLPTAQAIADLATPQSGGSFDSSNYFVSMYESRWVVLVSIFISLFVALIYIKLMDWFAVYIAWITIVVIEVSLACLGYFAYAYSSLIEDNHGGESTSQSTSLFWIGITCWILASLYALMMCCNMRSLRISIAVIETAADFFADTKRIAFVPLLYFCVWCGIFVFWLWGLAGVASITDSEITVTSVQFQQKDVHRGENTNWLIAGMVMGMVWVSMFLLACNEFAIICASVTWYFSRKDIPDDDGIPGDADVWKGFVWTFRYNCGTLALGSFILTIVWLIRAIFEYIGEKVHDASAGNKCTECLLCCIRCCLDCFDRFIRYLNRNAYIYCAIASESFCPSALHSFLLILKNMAKFAFVENIADAFMFLAKTFIAVLTTLAGYSLLPVMTDIRVDPVLPCCFIFAFAYLVACQFISIFDVSANTILQCYLFDADIAGSAGLDMRHVPKSLVKFLQLQGDSGAQVNASTKLIDNNGMM